MTLALEEEINWNLLFTGTFTQNFDLSLPISEYGYIGEMGIPFLFNSSYLTIKAISPDAKSSWKQLGYARQKIKVGIDGGLDAFLDKEYPLFLSQPTLLAFDPNFSSNYTLSFKPFKWFKTVTMYIYEYIGTL